MNTLLTVLFASIMVFVFLIVPVFFGTLGVLNGIEQFFRGDKILGLISINVSILLFSFLISKGK